MSLSRRGFLKAALAAVAVPYVDRALAALQAVVPANVGVTLSASGRYFRAGDLVRIATTGEVMRVRSIDPIRRRAVVERGFLRA